VHVMAHRSMGGVAAPTGLPLIGVERRATSGDVRCDQCRAGTRVGVVAGPEPMLACVPRQHTDNSRTIVGRGPVPFTLISTLLGWIHRLRVRRACFPRVLVQLVGLESHTTHLIGRGGLVQVASNTLPQDMELFP
jgi:hypothetical protein